MNISLYTGCIFIVFSIFCIPIVEGKDWEWSVSPLLGIYSPQLGDLNDGEFKAPLPGSGTIIVDLGSSADFNFVIQNPLPDIRFATESGVEIQLKLDKKNSILFGIGSWEGVSTSTILTEMPFQGELSQVLYERSGRISSTQYSLGWRRRLIKNEKSQLFSRLALNELLDIDYRESLVFKFQSGPARGFKRVVAMHSQATGILMVQAGIGGETYITDWLTLGFDIGYLQGIGQSTLGNASIKDDFQNGDNLDLMLPAKISSGQRILYLDKDGSTYRPLLITFDGWRAVLRVSFHF